MSQELLLQTLEGQAWEFDDGRTLTSLEAFMGLYSKDLDPALACRPSGGQEALPARVRFPLCGRYAIVSRLGEGNFGTVYLCFDASKDPRQRGQAFVALKRPSEALLERYAEAAGVKADPVLDEKTNRENARLWARVEMGKAFAQEALLTARLSMCPQVVAILDQNMNVPFMVLEYCDGGSLSTRMRKPYTLDDVLRWGHELASGLEAAHNLVPNCLVHRDLKPENILIAQGSLKISDFGTAQMVDQMESLSSLKGGFTPVYAAPEAFEGRAYPGTDIWSVGVILYELVAGQRPFKGMAARLMANIIQMDPPPLSGDLKVDPPPELVELINACLAKEHSQRLDASQVKARLETLIEAREAARREAQEAAERARQSAISQSSAPGPAPAPAPIPVVIDDEPLTPENSGDFQIKAPEAQGFPWITLAPLAILGLLLLSWQAPIVRSLSTPLLGSLGGFGQSFLQSRLKDSSRRVREAACRALKARGASSAGVWIDGLGSRHEDVRRQADAVLRELGPKAKTALLKALKNADEQDLERISDRLVGLGPELVPDLIERLADPDRSEQASEVLVAFGEPALPPLIQKLTDGVIQSEVKDTLMAFGAAAYPHLIDALLDRERHAAAQGLLREAEADAIPDLIDALDDAKKAPIIESMLVQLKDKELRALVQCLDQERHLPTLKKLLLKHKQASRAILAEALKDKDRALPAADILGSMGTPGVPVLLELFASHTPWSQRVGDRGLRAAGAEAVPLLLKEMDRNKRPDVLIRGAKILGSVGPKLQPLQQREVIRALIHELEQSDLTVREHAQVALVDIGPQAVPLLLDAMPKALTQHQSHIRATILRGGLKNIDALVQASGHETRAKNAQQCLTQLGAKAVPALVSRAYRGSEAQQRALITVFKGLGKRGIEALISELRSSQKERQGFIAGILGQLEDNASPVIGEAIIGRNLGQRQLLREILVKMGEHGIAGFEVVMSSDDRVLRLLAAESLAETPASAKSVSILKGALRDSSSYVREAAANSLAEMKNFGKAAEEALQQCLRKDKSSRVRQAVRKALKSLGLKEK